MDASDIDLSTILAGMKSTFGEGELAYYWVTGKSETPFRDRLAYVLHQRLKPLGYSVAREYERIDIAVFNGAGEPIVLLELKASYSFDGLEDPVKLTAKTSSDEIKAAKKAHPNTAIYSLLLCAHMDSLVSVYPRKLVKYCDSQDKMFRKYPDASAHLVDAVQSISDALEDRKVEARGLIDCGRAFNQIVTMAYWLVRNNPQPVS